MSYDKNDTKRVGKILYYHLWCDKCGKDRGYNMKSRAHMPCKPCSHAGKDYIGERTSEYRAKMSAAKKGQIPHNKSNISDAHRKVRHNVSSLIGHYLSDRRYNKHKTSKLLYVNFSIPELMKYLEAKFEPGMSWENYGRKRGMRCWEIDHVEPDSWFNYESPDDPSFKKCWSLDNLQPKWADENIQKSNKFAG